MNTYCLIFVCSSLFGASQVDQRTEEMDIVDVAKEFEDLADSLLPKDGTPTSSYSDPENMMLPNSADSKRSVQPDISKGVTIPIIRHPKDSSRLSEFLIPPSTSESED